jgi:hypothetical protein
MSLNCNCHGSGGAFSQTVAAVLERPRYSPGLILQDSDLTAAVEYTQNLSRLMFRNLFGCGVICGLIVKVDERCGLTVTVGAGLALDGCGDPVQLAKPVIITVDERTVGKWKNGWKEGDPDKNKFWIVLCGKEKFCEPRALVCDSDEFDGATQTTRVRSQSEVAIALTRPECVCQCAPRTSATNGNAHAAAARRALDGQPPIDGVDECQAEHNSRDECVEDCGCGTACACGCCVLLAEVSYALSATGTDVWNVRHNGVRRLVRPMMLRDPHADAPAIVGREGAEAAEDTIVAFVDGQPMTGRELGDLLVGHFMKDSKPKSVKLENLKVVLEAADAAASAANNGGANNQGGGT